VTPLGAHLPDADASSSEMRRHRHDFTGAARNGRATREGLGVHEEGEGRVSDRNATGSCRM